MTKIDDIKNRYDIVDFISKVVLLKKTGTFFQGFCPFHNNVNTPSFSVFPETQSWYCFGACGEGGDIINFIMKHENCDFTTALNNLTNNGSLSIPPSKPPKPPKPPKPKRFFSNIVGDVAANIELWQNYAPTLSRELIAFYGLSHGVLEMNMCKHKRLIVPMRIGGQNVGMRGRIIKELQPKNCRYSENSNGELIPVCCEKWSQSANGQSIIYNGAVLLNAFDRDVPETQKVLHLGDTYFRGIKFNKVIIVENSIDAILLQNLLRDHNYAVVATQGINPSKEIKHNLSLALRVANTAGSIEKVIIAYDKPDSNNHNNTIKSIKSLSAFIKEQGLLAEMLVFPHDLPIKDFGELFKLLACGHKSH